VLLFLPGCYAGNCTAIDTKSSGFKENIDKADGEPQEVRIVENVIAFYKDVPQRYTDIMDVNSSLSPFDLRSINFLI